MTPEVSEAIVQLIYYFYGVIIAHVMISGIVNEMWKILREEAKRDPRSIGSSSLSIGLTLRRYPWQTAVVGITERILYIASVQIGRPEFIAIWLTLKTVARSRRWTEEQSVPGRAIYNNFLAGNALSILYALVAAAGIQWAVGPARLQNSTLAIGVPVTVLIASALLWFILYLARRRRRPPWSS